MERRINLTYQWYTVDKRRRERRKVERPVSRFMIMPISVFFRRTMEELRGIFFQEPKNAA
jgi:hypothetical protein